MIALNVPFVTWCVIALAMVALIMVRVCHRHSHRPAYRRHHAHIVEFGSEREELFIPGDRIINKDDRLNDFDED